MLQQGHAILLVIFFQYAIATDETKNNSKPTWAFLEKGLDYEGEGCGELQVQELWQQQGPGHELYVSKQFKIKLVDNDFKDHNEVQNQTCTKANYTK